MPWRFFLVCLLATATVRAAEPSNDEFFESRVRPVLINRCNKCHGAEAKIKGGLRLDSRDAILRGGDSGPAAVPGKPDDSGLIAAIRYIDEPRMPPDGKLNESEIKVLTEWVARGLPWPKSQPVAQATKPTWRITDAQRAHWSYQPIKNPPLPNVKDATWSRAEFDRFIVAGLEAKGLKPAPRADKTTLIRRATFDLTGLPPTPEEVDAFLKDGAADAFAKVVDRLLASPRYGERWGRHWLDVVRYADSRDARGVGAPDDITEAYRYRDWVVAAFNRDLPYDRFIIDQIAGDLVPAASRDAFSPDGMIATGLLTIGEWGTGDADKEKMMTDIVADQIDVVSRAFMGLTIGCARCHDHKFDPISQADYYGLAGIFFSTHILPEPGAKTAGSPMLRTPLVPRQAIEAAEAYRVELARLEGEQKTLLENESNAFAIAQLDTIEKSLAQVSEYIDSSSSSPKSLQSQRWLKYLGLDSDGTLLSQPNSSLLGAAGIDYWRGPTSDTPWIAANRTNAPVKLLTFVLPEKSINIHPGPNEAAGIVWASPVAGEIRVEGKLGDVDPTCGDGVTWTIEHRQGRVWKPVASGELGNGARLAIPAKTIRVSQGDAIRLLIGPRGEYTCDSTTIDMTITHGATSWNVTRELVPDLLLSGRGNPHPDHSGKPDVWRLVSAPANQGVAKRNDLPGEIATWLAALNSNDKPARSTAAKSIKAAVLDPKNSKLRTALTASTGPLWPALGELPEASRAKLAANQTQLDAHRAKAPAPFPLGIVAQEGGVPTSAYAGVHDTRILARGEYTKPGAVVPRHFPVIVAGDGPPPKLSGSGRLELAHWIARGDHPLTARVMANRLWSLHFGDGLVRTVGNFGALGEAPSNPELLDHLAQRFIASGWSIKQMHRLIMNSAAYAQSSYASKETLTADPENRLFGRMNRRRLEAEAIRDSLLAVSGRLDSAMGGPSYREFDVPRRTLYLMTIRSDRSSFGPLFDAADATAIVDKRVVSTVAPQALFLLNSPFATKAADTLATRLMREAKTTDDRITRAYALIYARSPTQQERTLGRSFLSDSADEATWSKFAHILLCGNEFLFVD